MGEGRNRTSRRRLRRASACSRANERRKSDERGRRAGKDKKSFISFSPSPPPLAKATATGAGGESVYVLDFQKSVTGLVNFVFTNGLRLTYFIINFLPPLFICIYLGTHTPNIMTITRKYRRAALKCHSLENGASSVVRIRCRTRAMN